MEYNNNIYLTISHENCETLGLGGPHRMNNNQDVCILEYASMESIPEDVSNLLIQTYTHQEALELVQNAEWVSEMPF